MSLEALPCICLSEFIATDVVFSTFYAFRSKVAKCAALCMVGDLKGAF